MTTSERLHRMKSRFRQRSERLDCPRYCNIREGNRKEHAETRIRREILKHVDVSTDQRRLRDHTDRITKLSTDFQTATRQFVIRFERNVRIGSE